MDRTFNISFSVQKNPGVYALLLGSGISRSAGVPTGWEIVQDLIHQLSAISAGQYHEDMGYDELLEALGKTEAERNAILREYFEPTASEREQSIKVPSEAHRSIAKLVKAGYIKVIITTNFDRLLEIALADEGITPDVIRSEPMIQGTQPLRHSAITIVQVHGDYRDIRTLNTAKELESYTPEKNKYLDSIFAEYGLIVCGWSAKWDKALRDAIFRNPQRWYSTYWVEPNNISDEAKDVIHFRRAEIIQRQADEFFADLLGQVESLTKLNREHPLTIAIAVERVKKALVNESHEIDFQDLLGNEVDLAYQQLTLVSDYRPSRFNNNDEFEGFINTLTSEHLAISEIVINMIMCVCWYGKGKFTSTIADTMKRMSSPKDAQNELNSNRKMSSLLLMYAIGIAAIHKENWIYLSAIINIQIASPRISRRTSILEEITKYQAFNLDISMHRYDVDPLTHYLKIALRPLFISYIPLENEYHDAFDLFEMILALVTLSKGSRWINHNAAMRDYISYGRIDQIKDFWIRGATSGKDWGFLTEFFHGSRAQLEQALGKYQEAAMNYQTWIPKHDIPDYKSIYKNAFV